VYTDEDVVELGGMDDDSHIPDQLQDIKPRHHKGKVTRCLTLSLTCSLKL
jgi:hypothetical protein